MSTLKLDTLSNKAGTASVPSDTIVSGTAKAWVNFNGTGTVAIRRAFNVSSITDRGTGQYTVNFTNALADDNYAVAAFGNRSTTTAYPRLPTIRNDGIAPSTSAFAFDMVQTGAAASLDESIIFLSFFS